MGIANRDKDASEQNYVLSCINEAVATGVSVWVGHVPTPGQILEMKITGRGLSAVPCYNLAIVRWTSAGITHINPGSVVTLGSAFGLSGAGVGQTYASNSSLAAVQAGDLLVVNSSVADSAVTELMVSVVIKATQDIKKSFDI